MDQRTSDAIDTLHPAIREEVRRLVNECNQVLTGHDEMIIVQAYRTFEEQNALYAKGRTAPGNIVTKAKGGQSYHNYGLAIDFCLKLNGKDISWDTTKDFDGDGVADWLEVARIFQREGYTWGKAFNDLPHFEKTFNLNWRDMLKKYDAKDYTTEKVNGVEYKYINLK